MDETKLLRLLKSGSYTVKELATKLKTDTSVVKDALVVLFHKNVLLEKFGNKYTIVNQPKASDVGKKFPFYSNRNHQYTFGFLGDTHLCSKYERLDVLNSLYNIYKLRGIKYVFHTGNYLDGEAKFNVHDLKVHGFQNQIDYLVEHYPKHEGISTYAVTAAEHEGWLGRSTGVNVGAHVEASMLAGGHNWIDLGYMESFVTLENSESGKKATALIVHPGGGASYAISYKMQKLVESFSGGEKPDVLFAGHTHKISYNIVRGVHAIQTGCCQDQTPFMRQKNLDAHVGGGIVTLTQDPQTGILFGCAIELFKYEPKERCNGRWSHSGKVKQVKLGT